jgi:hypothetical protein
MLSNVPPSSRRKAVVFEPLYGRRGSELHSATAAKLSQDRGGGTPAQEKQHAWLRQGYCDGIIP